VSGRKERNVISATQPEISVIDRKQSLEVRWILPGTPAAAVADWFARFETSVESREEGVELGTGNSRSYAQWLTDGRVVSGR